MNKEEFLRKFKVEVLKTSPRYKVKPNQLSKVIMNLIDIYLKEGDLEVVNLESVSIGETQVKDILGRTKTKYGVIVREIK